MIVFNNTYFPMENFNNSIINNSSNHTADIAQIPPFILIIIFASIYIIVVLSHKTFRAKKFNWLAVNICFSSVIFASIQLFSAVVHLNNIPETVISCRSKGFITNMAACHILYSHCAATFCRLLSIQYPHKPLFRSSHWLLGSIAVSEIIGTLVAIPDLFFDGFSCTSNYGTRFLQIYTSISTVLISVLIVFGCNIAIFRHVRQSSKRVHDTNNNNANCLSNRDMYLCKMMLLAFGVFFIGWAPIFIQELLFSDQTPLPSAITIFFQILQPICVFADVLLLIYADRPVRKLLIKALTCHGRVPCLFKP